MPVVVGAALIAAWLGAMHWSQMLPEGGRQAWRVFVYALIGAPFAYLFSAMCLWLMDPTHSNAPFVSYLTGGIYAVVIVALVGAVAAYRYRDRFYPPQNITRTAHMADGLKNSIVLLAVLAFLGGLWTSLAIGEQVPDRSGGTGYFIGGIIGTALAILLFSLIAFFIVRDVKGGGRDAHAGLMGGTFACLAATGLGYLGALSELNG
jgi:hypothetical protein